MYLYWRVQIDLNEMGSVLIFHHPSLIRAFKAWVKKNAGGLAFAQDLCWEDIGRLCTNPN